MLSALVLLQEEESRGAFTECRGAFIEGGGAFVEGAFRESSGAFHKTTSAFGAVAAPERRCSTASVKGIKGKTSWTLQIHL